MSAVKMAAAMAKQWTVTIHVTTSRLSDWLDRLGGVRKAGSDYKALCPAHADKNPSLSVSEGDDGRVLVKCFAGCTFEDIRVRSVATGRPCRSLGASSARFGAQAYIYSRRSV